MAQSYFPNDDKLFRLTLTLKNPQGRCATPSSLTLAKENRTMAGQGKKGGGGRKIGRGVRTKKYSAYNAHNRRRKNKLKRILKSSGEVAAKKWDAEHGAGRTSYVLRHGRTKATSGLLAPS